MKHQELLEKVITEMQDCFGSPERILYYSCYYYRSKKFWFFGLKPLRSWLEASWSFRTSYCSDYCDLVKIAEQSYGANAWLAPKSYGQCYVTARALNLIFGWAILYNRKNGNNHYWNKLPTGQEIDFTSDQMGGDGIRPTKEFKGTGKIRKFKPLQECKSINPRLKTFLEALAPEDKFVDVFNPDLNIDHSRFFEKHPTIRKLTQEEVQEHKKVERSFRCLVTYAL
jgi:hypothetical protein